jgi:hypothetical protein
MGKRFCEVEDCGVEISDGRGSQGGLPVCDACRGAQYYWNKKGSKALKARRERLQFFDKRFDYLQLHVARLVTDAKERVANARKRVAETRTAH